MMFFKKRDAEILREEIIKDFRKNFPNVVKPFHDDSVFELLFQIDQLWYTLKLFLPADFPQSKPVIQVIGAVTHPWLDQYKQVVGCEKLTRWNKSSSLVEVVKHIISTIQSSGSPIQPQQRQSVGGMTHSSSSGNDLNTLSTSNYPTIPNATPPPVFGINQPMNHRDSFHAQSSPPPSYGTVFQYPTNPPPYQTPPPAYNSNQFTPVPIQQPPSQTTPSPQNQSARISPAPGNSSRQSNGRIETAAEPKTKIPDIPHKFPELDSLSEDQLERLLVDSVALSALAVSHSEVEPMRELLNITRQSNQERVTNNLKQREKVIAAYEEVEEMRKELLQLVQEYTNLIENAKKKKFVSPDNVIAQINAIRNDLERETDKLGKSFVEGSMEIGVFLQDFLEKRKHYYSLTHKLESVR